MTARAHRSDTAHYRDRQAVHGPAVVPTPRLPPSRPQPKGVFELKRLVPAAVAAIAMLLPGAAQAKRTERTTETRPVTIEIKSETCSMLPPGTLITGTGTLTSITWTTKRRGHRTVTNSELAPGTATDQAGNQYTFLYSNQSRVSNTRRRPKVYSGIMIDVFTLQGTGAATLSNGFLAKYTTDFGDLFRLRPIDAFGDPIDFKTVTAHCDPL
jgi:hypothetical protein